jgi:hypothetical protein
VDKDKFLKHVHDRISTIFPPQGQHEWGMYSILTELVDLTEAGDFD